MTVREVSLRLLVIYLLLDLIIRSVPILLTHLVRIGQLSEDVDVVVRFGATLARCFLNLISCQVHVDKCAFEVEYSIFWLSIRNGDVVATFFQYALTLSEHDGDVEVGLVAAEERVDRRLVHNEVKEVILVFELAHVHHVPIHVRP